MKRSHYRYSLLIICIFFLSNIGLYSQCKVEFLEEKGDTLFFRNYSLTDSLIYAVKLYLTYSKDAETNYINYLSKVEIGSIDLRKKGNNKKISFVACSDTINNCLCDTLNKYLNSYYRNPKRIPTAFELTTLDKYKYYHGNIKIGLNGPVICIYPYRKR